jgi:hypothetical protein
MAYLVDEISDLHSSPAPALLELVLVLAYAADCLSVSNLDKVCHSPISRADDLCSSSLVLPADQITDDRSDDEDDDEDESEAQEKND